MIFSSETTIWGKIGEVFAYPECLCALLREYGNLDPMKRMWQLLLGLLLVMGSPGLRGQGIHFETGDFTAAQAKASKEGKMLMMVVCADWMEVCTIMEQDIFTEAAIGEAFNPFFVSWRLDATEVQNSPFFAGVRILSIPEFIFFDKKGLPQYREKKLHDHDEMLAMALAARNPQNHLDRLAEKYKAGNRDLAFVKRYIIEMDAAGHDMAAPSREYLKRIPRESMLETDNWIIATIGLQHIDLPEYQYILAHKAEFAKQFGEDNVGAFLLSAYRLALAEAIRDQNAPLLARCKAVVNQVMDAASAKSVNLQDELAYHAAGKNWPAYEKAALALMAIYNGDDATLYNDVAWAIAVHIPRADLVQKAQAWAQKSVELQPATWNWHTLATLQMRNGDLEGAEKSALASLALAESDSEEAKEAKKLLEEIRNSR
jgi:hypothetical protein